MITFVRKETDHVFIGLSRGLEYVVLPENIVKDMCLAIITPPELPRCGMFAEPHAIVEVECMGKLHGVSIPETISIRIALFPIGGGSSCFEILCVSERGMVNKLNGHFYVGLEEVLTIREALGYV